MSNVATIGCRHSNTNLFDDPMKGFIKEVVIHKFATEPTAAAIRLILRDEGTCPDLSPPLDTDVCPYDKWPLCDVHDEYYNPTSEK